MIQPPSTLRICFVKILTRSTFHEVQNITTGVAGTGGGMDKSERITRLRIELVHVLIERDVHESASEAVVGEDEEDRLQRVMNRLQILKI